MWWSKAKRIVCVLVSLKSQTIRINIHNTAITIIIKKIEYHGVNQ